MFSPLEKSKSFNNNADVVITYILLYGAIYLDGIAFFTLVFSDWTVATPTVQGKLGSFMTVLLVKYLELRRPNWSSTKTEQLQSSNYLDWGRQVLFRRRAFEYPEDAEITRSASAAPGTGAFSLQRINGNNNCKELLDCVTGADYLLMWHVATLGFE
ncbi:hypothetical protein TIFTF001_020100 [Ficus carica]|uniref:DUF4220 domain-containing protein n=1 Tax=Ficus carica TaxID=3494 RepID=A0AA88AE97_FICCA|nr:hypothetical protein TIFTF001_020100 [Ficus carica]